MDDKLFKELDANLKEAVKVARGTKAPKSVYVVLKPAEIKAIRVSVGMSQSVFASTFRLSLDTLNGWEQGKRKPDAAAANILRRSKKTRNSSSGRLLPDSHKRDSGIPGAVQSLRDA